MTARPRQAVAELRPRRVRFPLHPHRDESFQGFVARTVAWNFLESADTLLKEASLGLGPKPKLGGAWPSEPHLDALSYCLGAPRTDIERMLHAAGSDGSGYVSYFGTTVRLTRLDPTRRRVSPTSLRASPHHRAQWAIRTLPFCAASWDILISQCAACGGKLGWLRTRGIDFCEHCGFDLKTMEPTQVPMELRGELSLLADLMSPLAEMREVAGCQLPANVRPLQPGLIFELAIAFGRAASALPDGSAQPRWRLGLPEMAAGIRLLRDYRREIPKLLGNKAENARRNSFFIRLARLEVLRESELLVVLNEITDEFEPIRHGPQRLKIRREEQELLTLGQAARRLSIDNAGLRGLIDAGVLSHGTSRGGSRLHNWVSPETVEQLRQRLRERLSAVAFSRELGIPFSGVCQLVAMGLIQEFDDQALRAAYRGLQLSRASALAFADDLRSKASIQNSDERRFSLSDVFHGIGGQEKPWAAFLQAAIAGELPSGLARARSTPMKISELTVCAEVARDILRGCRPDLLQVPIGPDAAYNEALSRQDVETYLNCFPRDVSWLIAAGRLHSTSPMNGFSRDAVTALGREFIATREINWRWRIPPGRLETLAAAGGIRRLAGPFWPRDAIEVHFANCNRFDEFAGSRPEAEAAAVKLDG